MNLIFYVLICNGQIFKINIKNFSSNDTDTTTCPKRNCKPPSFEGFSIEINLPTSNANENSNYFKINIYFEIVDRIWFELNCRVKTDSMLFYKAISTILNVDWKSENICYLKLYYQYFNFDYDLALVEMKIISNTINSSNKLLFEII